MITLGLVLSIVGTSILAGAFKAPPKEHREVHDIGGFHPVLFNKYLFYSGLGSIVAAHVVFFIAQP